MIAGYPASSPKKTFIGKSRPPVRFGATPSARYSSAAPPRPVFQVPVQSWFDDMTDTELLDLIPFFEGLSQEDSVYSMLHRLCDR